MQPNPSSATDQGRNQKTDTSGNTVARRDIPAENRAAEGMKRGTPESATRPGATDPRIKTDRPGQNEVRQRGLHS